MRVAVRHDRSVTRVHGRDPVKMIQGLASNDIASSPEGEAVYTTFLTPKGKMIGDARVWRTGNEVWIEADNAATSNIREHLKKSVPPLFVRFEPADDLVVVSVAGELPAIETVATLRGVFRTDTTDIVVKSETLVSLESAEQIDANELEAARIEAGEPKWGAELTEDVIPLEAGLRHAAISETKGCYTGQEVIIRILHRGHVNRHLRRFVMKRETVPSPGSDIVQPADGKAVGRVTSATFSAERGAVVGLGYVRREVMMPATLRIGDRDAAFTEIESKVQI